MKNGINYKIERLEQQLDSLKEEVQDRQHVDESVPGIFEQLKMMLSEMRHTSAELESHHQGLPLPSPDEVIEPEKSLSRTHYKLVEEDKTTHELKTRARQQEVVARLGLHALSGIDLATLIDTVVMLVTETLETDFCQVFELLPTDDALVLRAGAGLPTELIGQMVVSADITSQMGYTLLSSEPVIVEDFRKETRFSSLEVLQDQGVSSMSVIIDGQFWPFGVLGTHSTKQRTFTGDDTNFLQAIANVLAQAIARKQTEEALRMSEERYRHLIELSFEAIVIHDLEKFLYANEAGARLYGASSSDHIIGKPIFDFVHADYLNMVKKQLQQAHKSGQTISLVEEKLVRRDGSGVDVEAVAISITYQGQLAIQVVARDITDRLRAQRVLQESEEKYRTLIEQSDDAIYLIHGGKFDVINRKFQKLFGVTQEDINHPDFTFTNIVASKSHKPFVEQAAKEGSGRKKISPRYEFTALDKDSNEIEVELTVSYPSYKGGLATQGVLRDITLRKRAEEALRKAHDELEERVVERTAELLEANEILKEQIAERKRTERALRKSENKHRDTANALTELANRQERLLAEKESILTISKALVSTTALNNLLDLIVSQAKYLTNVEGATVVLLSDNGKNFWIIGTPTEPLFRTEASAQIPVQGSLAGLALSTADVQFSNQAQSDERTVSIRNMLKPTVLHSLLCAPLIVQGRSLGVLLVWNKRELNFDTDDCRLMGLFADQAALALDNAHWHDRSRQLAIEQERHRLARELHDSVTQSLYSIALAAQTSLKLLEQKDTTEKLQDIIGYIQSFSQTALTEIRAQLYNLSPPVLADKGLVKSLLEHCDILMGQYALTIELRTDPELSLSMYQQEGLYYIAREVLWNIIKHAAATHVDMSLTRTNDQMILAISDNGVGFEPQVVDNEHTMGLANMEERANMLGGGLELQSVPNKGTRVIAWIPCRWP